MYYNCTIIEQRKTKTCNSSKYIFKQLTLHGCAQEQTNLLTAQIPFYNKFVAEVINTNIVHRKTNHGETIHIPCKLIVSIGDYLPMEESLLMKKNEILG